MLDSLYKFVLQLLNTKIYLVTDLLSGGRMVSEQEDPFQFNFYLSESESCFYIYFTSESVLVIFYTCQIYFTHHSLHF